MPEKQDSITTTIFRTRSQIELMLARSLLEAHQIPFNVRNERIQNLGLWSFLPDCDMEIEVPTDCRDEALQLMETLYPDEGDDGS